LVIAEAISTFSFDSPHQSTISPLFNSFFFFLNIFFSFLVFSLSLSLPLQFHHHGGDKKGWQSSGQRRWIESLDLVKALCRFA